MSMLASSEKVRTSSQGAVFALEKASSMELETVANYLADSVNLNGYFE